MRSQGRNLDIRDSTITRFMQTNAEGMSDIQQMRRQRIYEEMTDKNEDEEDIISSRYVLI